MEKKLDEPGTLAGYLQIIPLSQVYWSYQAILQNMLASSLIIPDAVNGVIQCEFNNVNADG